jgi:raffinose/stachyose/melibiose transport system permease protein
MSRSRRVPAGPLKPSQLVIVAVLTFSALLVLLPLFVMVINSFKTTDEIISAPLALPQTWDLSNFVDAWEQAGFSQYLLNSIVVTAGSLALILAVSSMAAFVLARHDLPGFDLLYLFFVLGLVMPIRLAIVPLLVMLRTLDMQNQLGLVLVYAASGLPFSIFLIANYFRSVPRELDDAARVDGATEFTLYRKVILPLGRPSLAVAAIYNLVVIWNDYFLPLVLIHERELRTIPLGITVFFGEHVTEWNLVFAGLTMSAIPVIVMFVLLSRSFFAGISAGAVK